MHDSLQFSRTRDLIESPTPIRYKVSTNNFYWTNRLISCLVDSHYQTSIIHIERYQESTMAKNYQLIKKFDKYGDHINDVFYAA